MLEECGLPYTVKFVNIGKGEQFDPAFLQISPNNRIPAITDPDGPGGRPLSIFESGAILQYLGRKSGMLYPADERGRVEVDQWLFWQVGGLGPMAGQANHFRQVAPEQLHYAIERYTRETERLYKVLNARLAGRDFITGAISIADVACWGWIVPHRAQGQSLDDHPHLKAWFDRMGARPGVQRGFKLGSDLRRTPGDTPRPDEQRKGAPSQRPRV